MSAYQFARQGDGYVFNVSAAKGPIKGFGWLVFLWGSVFALSVLFNSPSSTMLFVASGVLPTILILVPGLAARQKGKAFSVSAAGITPSAGAPIARNRINEIEISNKFDEGYTVANSMDRAANVGFGHQLAAATGSLAAAHLTKKAQSSFLVTVQYGGTSTLLADYLTLNEAKGIRADILRVLNGQTLD